MATPETNANLIPMSKRTKEEQRAIARMGGLSSGRTRKMRKTLRDELKSILSCTIPKDSPHYARMKQQMRDLGIKGDPTVQMIPVLGMITSAAKNPKAAEFVRDTIGEKPVDMVEDVTPQAPVVLGMIPVEDVMRAKEEHEARRKGDAE